MKTPRRRVVQKLPPFPVFCQDVLGLDIRQRQGHMVIAKALDGEELDGEELELFQRYTGRGVPRPGGYSYGLTLVGRQAGKTELAAARLTYVATAASLAGARDVVCVGMSQDHRAAQRVLLGFANRFYEQPLLRALVAARTSDSITLRGGVKILVLPCRPASIRGLRCAGVVLDEVFFLQLGQPAARPRGVARVVGDTPDHAWETARVVESVRCEWTRV